MIRSYSWAQWPEVQECWEALHTITPDRSFFTSAPWVSVWLKIFGPELNPTIYVLEKGDAPRAAWILVRKTDPWRHVPLRRVYLGTAGEEEEDSPCVEYNGLVYDPEYYGDAVSALWEAIGAASWDDLVLTGVPPGLAQAIGQNRTAETRLVPTSGVDLEAIRGSAEYLKLLSHNTRQQLRKSHRFYERRGPLNVDVAETVDDRLLMLDELAALHQEAWKSRGQPGVFSSARFNAFHRQLIASFPESVQLLRVRAGSETIGALYSFLWEGVLHTYQSGFRYGDEGENNARPGLVVTALAVEHCISSTAIRYFDLMAGSGRYKKSLSTVRRELGWYVIRSATLRSRFGSLVRRVHRRFLSKPKEASSDGADS